MSGFPNNRHLYSTLFSLSVFSFCCSRCSYWSWYLRSGGDPGRAGQWLLLCPVPLPSAASAGSRSLVIPTHVPFSLLFLLQEFCLHHGALLVRLLLWLLCSGQKVEVMGSIEHQDPEVKNCFHYFYLWNSCVFVFPYRRCMISTSSLSTTLSTRPSLCWPWGSLTRWVSR